MRVKLIAITQPIVDNIRNCEELVEYAGRKCTASTERTGNNTAQFIKARIKQGHTSILEHVNFTFEIDGISRVCLAQLTRHRIGVSPSVESMRSVGQYDAEYITPELIKNNKELCDLYDSFIENTFHVYNTLNQNGIKFEDSRYVLPLATQTNLVLTVNLRALKHLFELRLDKAAQLEIQMLAQKMKAIVIEYCPNAL